MSRILQTDLLFLANDIQENPEKLQTISPALLEYVRTLISDVEIDLDTPLSDNAYLER